MQLPIHPLLRLPGRWSALPPRPRPHTDHPFGLSTGSLLATGSPHLSADPAHILTSRPSRNVTALMG
jgi:hypothetical protein